MADHQHQAHAFGDIDQLLTLGRAGGHRFFDQRMFACNQAGFRQGIVVLQRRGYSDRMIRPSRYGVTLSLVSPDQSEVKELAIPFTALKGIFYLKTWEGGDSPMIESDWVPRVLEAREVLPLGASRPKPVDISIVTASHKSLRDEVAGGRFRSDLYFRVGGPLVRLPALRERLDEIPRFV